MRLLLHTLLVAGGILLSPVVAAPSEPLTLETIQTTFQHTRAAGNSVCILLDGWQIAFLSPDGQKIGAVIVMEHEEAEGHDFNLSRVVSRLASLTGMGTPESMDFEDEELEYSLLVDRDVLDELAEEAEHAFSGSPVTALAYLLEDGYFCIHSIRRNGCIHWKTVKKSGVDLLMPMADKKLTAIEVTGRQQMNEFAAEVLAEKLGLSRNNAPASSRDALRQQLRCTAVPYMNTRSGILLARTNRRAAIGRQQAVSRMLASRNEGALSYPAEPSAWPVEEKEENATPKPVVEEKKETPPLTPEQARDAYIKYIQGL